MMKQSLLLILKWIPVFTEDYKKASRGYICASGSKDPRHEPQEPKGIPELPEVYPQYQAGLDQEKLHFSS